MSSDVPATTSGPVDQTKNTISFGPLDRRTATWKRFRQESKGRPLASRLRQSNDPACEAANMSRSLSARRGIHSALRLFALGIELESFSESRLLWIESVQARVRSF